MTDELDPTAPLATVAGAEIRQRVTGTLYVRWPDGRDENFPVGWSVRDVEAWLREGGGTLRAPPIEPSMYCASS